MNVGFFGTPDPKGCKACKAERDAVVQMEATEVWSPALAAYVDIWRCKECGRQVPREEGGEVKLTNPDGEVW